MREKGKKQGQEMVFNEAYQRNALALVNKYFPSERPLTHFVKERGEWVGDYLSHYVQTRPEVQSEFLVQLYGSEGINLPAGEKLGKFLSEITTYQWLSPVVVPDKEQVVSSVAEHLKRLKSPFYKVEFIECEGKNRSQIDDEVMTCLRTQKEPVSFKNTTFALQEKALKIPEPVWKSVRTLIDRSLTINGGAIDALFSRPSSDAISSEKKEVPWHIRNVIGNDLENHAAGIVAAGPDLRKENPFEPLMDIYAKGLWPIGIVNRPVDKKGLLGRAQEARFCVFIPTAKTESSHDIFISKRNIS